LKEAFFNKIFVLFALKTPSPELLKKELEKILDQMFKGTVSRDRG
jgi:hypothetical protein